MAVFNGLFDLHKMVIRGGLNKNLYRTYIELPWVITVMEMSFKKHSPEARHYRDYKYVDRTKFKHNLNKKLSEGISSFRVQVHCNQIN